MGFAASSVSPLSIDDVEEALVACHELWRRSPGAGRWPFAGDGPWHLAQAEVGDVGAAEFSETIITNERGNELRVRKVETLAPRAPLDAAEVSQRDRLTAWLQWIPVELDRRIVWHATGALHRGESRVPWRALAARLGWTGSAYGLAKRHRKALALVACRVNGWPAQRARAMLAGDGLVTEPVCGPRVPFVVLDEAEAQ